TEGPAGAPAPALPHDRAPSTVHSGHGPWAVAMARNTALPPSCRFRVFAGTGRWTDLRALPPRSQPGCRTSRAFPFPPVFCAEFPRPGWTIARIRGSNRSRNTVVTMMPTRIWKVPMTETDSPVITAPQLHDIARGYVKTALLRTALELRLFDELTGAPAE